MWRIKCSFMRTWFEFNDTSWETLEWRINHGSWVSVICGRRRGRAGGDVRRSCRGRRDGLLRTHERWGEWWQDKLSTATQYCVQKRSSGFVRKLLRFKSFSLNILPANIKRSHHSQTQPNFLIQYNIDICSLHPMHFTKSSPNVIQCIGTEAGGNVLSCSEWRGNVPHCLLQRETSSDNCENKEQKLIFTQVQ